MRLVAVFLLLALAMSASFVLGMQRAFSGGWRELVRPLLTDYVDRLAVDLGDPPDLARARALADRLPIWIRVRGPQVNFDTRGSGASLEEPGFEPPLPRPGEPPPPLPPDLGDGDHAAPGAGPRRRPHHPPAWRMHLPRGAGSWLLTRVTADGHVVHFGLEVVDFERRPRAIGWVTLATLLLLTGCAYLYVRHLLAPLAAIRAGVARYGEGDFDTPIPVRRPDELGQLAGQVNQMASQIQAMLDAKRALLLAISHELRSPLTRARLNAELVDDGPARQALLADLAAMRDLITDLLESERLAAGHSALHREPVDLGRLLHQLLDEQFGDRPVQRQIAVDLPELAVDAPRLRLAVRNLLDNALRHGQPDAAAPADATTATVWLSLTAGRADEPPRARPQAGPLLGVAPGDQSQVATASAGVWISVRDRGPGVATDQLGQLGQAFWRADAARQRRTGGVGLGLYLVRLVAEAHGGRLVFQPAEPGLLAALWLPQVTAQKAPV
ncbi:MAG: hypothetical protein RL722_2036 [Pseudomonadota bacterium]|jgi:signal transduction histidine kinase